MRKGGSFHRKGVWATVNAGYKRAVPEAAAPCEHFVQTHRWDQMLCEWGHDESKYSANWTQYAQLYEHTPRWLLDIRFFHVSFCSFRKY